MAALLKTAKGFKITRSLFREENGSPISFFTDVASEDLKEIIQKGGGKISEVKDDAKILLCEKKTDNKINSGYLPFDFIVDCVKKNIFLNIEKYRSENLGLKASSSKEEPETIDSNDEENMVGFIQPLRIHVKARDMTGRKKYSDVDDFNIIKYLVNNGKYDEVGGNVVWKRMQSLQVTDHSHQSMKARFKSQILPEIDTYDIPAEWKALLTGSDNTKRKSNAKGLHSFDDLEQWKRHKFQSENECNANGTDLLSKKEEDVEDSSVVSRLRSRKGKDCSENGSDSLNGDEENDASSSVVSRKELVSRIRSSKEIDVTENSLHSSHQKNSADLGDEDLQRKGGRTSSLMKPTARTFGRVSPVTVKDKRGGIVNRIVESQPDEISSLKNVKLKNSNTEKMVPHSPHGEPASTENPAITESDDDLDSFMVTEANNVSKKRRIIKISKISGPRDPNSPPKSLKDAKLMPDKNVDSNSNRGDSSISVDDVIDDDLDELILCEARKQKLSDDYHSRISREKKKNMSEEVETLNKPVDANATKRNRNIEARNHEHKASQVRSGITKTHLTSDSLSDKESSLDQSRFNIAVKSKSSSKDENSLSKQQSCDSDVDLHVSSVQSPDTCNITDKTKKETMARLSNKDENRTLSSKTSPKSLKPTHGNTNSDSKSMSSNDTRVSNREKRKKTWTNQEEDDEEEESDLCSLSSESEEVGLQRKRPKLTTADCDKHVGTTHHKEASKKYADLDVLINRIKFLSEEYGLEEEDAALMLKEYKGNFLAVNKYFES